MNINYYCLSLQKKIFDRFLVVKKESFDRNNIDVIKFKGIDGNHFKSSYEISKKYNIELGNKINKCSPILVAIAQSHRNIWKKISKDRKNSYNVIFEDDIFINSNNFKKEIKNILKDYKNIKGPKILLIGCLYTNNNNFINEKFSKIEDFSGLQCYILDRETAKYLYQESQKLEDQIDLMISDHIVIDKYVLNNQLVFDKNITSTSHNQRNIFLESFGIKILSKKIGVDFKLYIYSSYNISFTFNTLISVVLPFILGKSYFLFYLLFFVFEVLFYGGVTFITFLKGLNKYSKYDDDEVVNKLIDFILFTLILFYKY